MKNLHQRGALLCAVSLLTVTPAHAQLANPRPAAVGMGESFTAAARGYAAVSWNPAALALRGNPSTSAMIGTVRAASGMGPITLSDFGAHRGEVVTDGVKSDWLAEIVRAGGQSGSGGLDVTWATLQTGRFGLQVATSGRATNDLSPDVAELLLFGNAATNVGTRETDLNGSSVDMHLYTTFAAAYALPVQLASARLALGATVKYTIGHSMAVSETSSGAVRADSAGVRLSFPVAYAPLLRENGTYQLKSGGGIGVDVALALEAAPWTLAVTVQNIYNGFAWDAEALRYTPGELRLTESEREATFDYAPLSAAPTSLRERVAGMRFHPNVALGALLRGSDRLALTAEARFGSTAGISTRPPVHAGGGIEYRLLQWLPVQFGAAWIGFGPDRAGHQLSTGLGLHLGSFTMSAAAARRQTGERPQNILMLGLLSHDF